MSAFFGAGIAKGAQQVQEYEQGREARDLALEQARLQVKQTKDLMPVQQSQQEEALKSIQMQNQQLASQMFKRDTFDAFRLFESDGDPKHLNNFLSQAKQSPVGSSLFKNVARVDRLTPTPAVQEQLEQQGITDVAGFLADPELSKSMVMATMADGTQQLVDMEKLYAGTGYAQQMTREELELASARALNAQRLRSGLSVEKLSARERVAKQMAEDLGIPMWQAYEQLDSKSTAANGTESERLAKELMAQDPSLDYVTAMGQALEMKRAGTERERTASAVAEQTGQNETDVLRGLQKEAQMPTSVREAKAANEAATGLEKAFDGKFFETDFSLPENKRKAQSYIRELEAATQAKLGQEERKTARQMRQLVSLGDRAGTAITPEETGLLDSMLSNVNSYISDNVTDGKKGVAAYESFRNIIRNALFGATLTSAEITAFNKAAGTLGQQQGPVLAKLEEQLNIVKDNLRGLYDFQDEHLAHYYLGADLDKVDTIIEALEGRVQMLQRAKKGGMPTGSKARQSGDAPAPAPAPAAQPGARKPLSEIFGGQQ